MVALEQRGWVTQNPRAASTWFWNAGFAGLYDAAANTRLVAHYRSIIGGDPRGFDSDEEAKFISLFGATRKSQKALWASAICAVAFSTEQRAGRLPEELIAELDISILFSRSQIDAAQTPALMDDPDGQFRSCLNGLLVPRRLSSVIAKLGARESLAVCAKSEFGDFAAAQIPAEGLQLLGDWDLFRRFRNDWMLDFMKENEVRNIGVVKFVPNSFSFQIETV